MAAALAADARISKIGRCRSLIEMVQEQSLDEIGQQPTSITHFGHCGQGVTGKTGTREVAESSVRRRSPQCILVLPKRPVDFGNRQAASCVTKCSGPVAALLALAKCRRLPTRPRLFARDGVRQSSDRWLHDARLPPRLDTIAVYEAVVKANGENAATVPERCSSDRRRALRVERPIDSIGSLLATLGAARTM